MGVKTPFWLLNNFRCSFVCELHQKTAMSIDIVLTTSWSVLGTTWFLHPLTRPSGLVRQKHQFVGLLNHYLRNGNSSLYFLGHLNWHWKESCGTFRYFSTLDTASFYRWDGSYIIMRLIYELQCTCSYKNVPYKAILIHVYIWSESYSINVYGVNLIQKRPLGQRKTLPAHKLH